MSAPGPSGRSLGFDAVRALRNRTGLGNYARGVLRGLRAIEPASSFHLYSHRAPLPAFAGVLDEIGATLHQGPGGRLRQSAWRTWRLGRAAARDGVQLYHGLTQEIPRDMADTGVRSVVTFHDLIFEKAPHLFPPLDRWSYQWRYRWSARHADAIVATSRQTRDDLVAWYGIDARRITVVPPPRDPRFALTISPRVRDQVRARYGLQHPYVLSVGTLERRKNQQILIEAWAHRSAIDAPMLILVGRDNGEATSLARAIDRYRLGERVRILRDVASADLPALVQSATLALYPSRMEGFGIPVVEALSAGTPVIAAAGSGVEDAGGTAAAYCSPDDGGEWASAVAALLGNPGRRAAMTERGRSHAATFDMLPLAVRLRAVYDAVIAGNAGPDTPHPTEASVGRAR